ncbi:MAG: fibronectin type III domain-containing protein [Paludibacteraceae bacterium]|nr:fibronectin type III domain-containing protein [Paludibacteraceae bacterium]
MKKHLLLLAISSFAASVAAQQLTLPYEYGFEEPDTLMEFQHWVLNPGSDPLNDSIDKWCVGTAIHSAGQRALYISNDGGETTNCGATTTDGTNRKMVQFAYRDIQLPDGNYYISFDWICPNMKLYAGYVQYTDSANAPGSVATDITQLVNTDEMPSSFVSRVGPNTGADTWHNDFYTMRVTNPTNGKQRWYRMFFAFVNTERDSCQTGISCAVDNLQILKDGCQAPYNFEGDVQDCDHVVFTWRGDASRYQIQYRPLGADTWRNRMVNGGETSYTYQSMNEGNYDFRVRGICFEKDELGNNTDTIYSPYVYLSNFNVFCPELHCVNYLALNDTNVCRCTYGTSSYDGYSASSSSEVAFQTKGVVDFGWDNVNSRHTICWDTLATDERTNNQLRMVPHGYTASVRLGNWNWNNGTEAITYDYYVDMDNSILLVNYAIVMENPTGHDHEEMPRFVIQIADENGKVIDADCGVVDLNPLNEAGWVHLGGAGDNVVYKDWTTLGLNLDPYVGQHLLIRFINYDCFLSGHYGYAYFTVDCATARIKNTACGTQQSMNVIAPDGFLYEWRPVGISPSMPPVFTTRSVDIKNTDPTSWVCTLTSTEKANCKFDLEVNTTARYPQAEFRLEYEPEDCQNRYRVFNSSYIWTNEEGQRHEHRDEVCDEFEWDFGIGEEGRTNEANPGYIYFPEEGGMFHLTLDAMIGVGEGSCRSSVDTILYVPRLGDTNIDTTVTICLGGYYEFHGERKFLEEPGEADYLFQGKDPKTGCMSNDKLHLVVVPNSTTLLSDTTVCYGESVSHGGHSRSTTGDLVYTVANMYGCDSMVVQHVTVLPEIAPEITWQEIDEEHEFASINVVFPDDSTIAYFTFEGKQYNSSTVLTDLTGGNYDLVFYNDFGCAVTEEVKLKAGCLRNMIFQRWNDVLSLKNAEYNGGLTFRSYQWCRNGEPIEGAVKSYYYQEGGLTAGAEYTCRVVIEDGTEEGTPDETCTFVPDMTLGAPALSPTLLTDGDVLTVSVPEDALLSCYTPMGMRVFETALQTGDNYINADLNKGVYVMIIRLSDGERQYRVVRN